MSLRATFWSLARSLGRGILPIALAATACHVDFTHDKDPKSTSELALDEIGVDLSAQSYEDGEVSLYASTHYKGSLSLGVGDTFSASVPGAEDAGLSTPASAGWKLAIPTAIAPPFDVSIALVRSGKPPATSTVSLPAPPRVTRAPSTLTQGEDLVLDLDAPPPPGVAVRLRLLASEHADVAPECLTVTTGSILEPTKVDGARITLASSTLFAKPDKHQAAPTKSCPMMVRVRFETKGHRSEALGEGTVEGLSERPATATPITVTRTDL